MKIVHVHFGEVFLRDLGRNVVEVSLGQSHCMTLEYEALQGQKVHVLVANEATMEAITKVLNHLYGSARDVMEENNEQV